jgi:hypothetical protein
MRERLNLMPLVVHGNYLTNAASRDPAIRDREGGHQIPISLQ